MEIKVIKRGSEGDKKKRKESHERELRNLEKKRREIQERRGRKR